MKKKIRKTGEIVDVICYSGGCDRSASDSVSYVDSEGNEKTENLNYYWDFEFLDNNPEDDKYWERLRNKAALEILVAKLSSGVFKKDTATEIYLSINDANNFVNELIKNKLKIKNNNGEERMQTNESV